MSSDFRLFRSDRVLGQLWHAPRTNRWMRSIGLTALAVTLVGTRFVGYRHSLWHDEIYTVRQYIEPGPAASFHHYGANDHILFSLLCWLTIYLPRFGDSAFRLWSIGPFVIAVALTSWWLCHRAGRLVGLLFGLLATLSPLLLFVSTEARGYGLAFLAMAVMTISASEAMSNSSRRWLSLFVLAGVMGTWTLPTLVLPFVGISGVLLFHPRTRRGLIPRLIAAGAAIGLFYVASAGALRAASAQHFGAPFPWHAPLTGAATELAGAFIPLAFSQDAWLQDVLGALVAPLVVVGWIAARRQIQHIGAITAVPVLVTFAALTAGRVFVEPRFVSWLLVPVLVVAAFGLEAAFQRRWGGAAAVICASGLMTAAAIVGIGEIEIEAKVPNQDNRDAARAVVADLQGSPGQVILNVRTPLDVEYYLPPQVHILAPSPPRLDRLVCSSLGTRIIVVEQLTPGIHAVDRACLAGRHADATSFAQRYYGGRITVWNVARRS